MIAIDSAAPGRRTVAEQVYEQIKVDLLTGAFTPGAALLTRELLARYDCGISPLREALARLVGEGFLAASGHRGVRVPLPSCADLDDIYRIRIMLECEALDLAMKHGDDHWEAAALAACHRLERAPLPGAGEDRAARATEWEARHRAFHTALVAAAPAPRLLRLVVPTGRSDTTMVLASPVARRVTRMQLTVSTVTCKPITPTVLVRLSSRTLAILLQMGCPLSRSSSTRTFRLHPEYQS